MRRTTKLAACASVLGMLGATSAQAVESGFYLGVLGGQTKVDINKAEIDEVENDPDASSFSSTTDEESDGLGLFLGGQFGRWFALELQYADLGKASYHAESVYSNVFPTAPRDGLTFMDYSTDTTAAALSGILTIPIGNRFALGVRAGVAYTVCEINGRFEARRGTTVLFSESEDDELDNTSLTYGVSLEWDPFDHFGLRLDFQRFKDVAAEEAEEEDEEDEDGFDIDLISLSIVGRF